jgi:L-lactate permease
VAKLIITMTILTILKPFFLLLLFVQYKSVKLKLSCIVMPDISKSVPQNSSSSSSGHEFRPIVGLFLPHYLSV